MAAIEPLGLPQVTFPRLGAWANDFRDAPFEELHVQRLSHGDLKPANILVDASSPDAPTIVDLIDFTAAGDGEVRSARYAPETGDGYERDCFAVTVIAEELLEGVDVEVADRVHDAIRRIRTDEPINATLLPLVDALAAPKVEPFVGTIIRLGSRHAAPGELLPDEGRYYLRPHPWRKGIVIRGACEEIEIDVDPSGKPIKMERRAVDQSRIRFLSRFEFGDLVARVVVEDASITNLVDVEELLRRDDVVMALASKTQGHPSTAVVSLEEEASERQERDIVPREPPEDDLIEAIAAAIPPSGDVAVGRLWQALVDAERELVTYGQAADHSHGAASAPDTPGRLSRSRTGRATRLRLYTATLADTRDNDMIQAFHASMARNAEEVRARLVGRLNPPTTPRPS